MIEIYDDFLPKDGFFYLENYIFSKEFPWYYASVLGEGPDRLCDELDDMQFINMMYLDFMPQGNEFHIIEPIIRSPKLRVTSLFRVKANMNPRTQEIIKHGFHLDVPYNETTAIYYVNSNNGYTEFEDGTKVESVANRLVKFDSNIRHTGTTCTDSKIRCVINFNYTSLI
tara:strand:+ start:96 stop:605 length:510 start_codon:yes stop_codon:yes gene_type:complete